MVPIKAQAGSKTATLTRFALLLLLILSVGTGCTRGPLAHIPPFRVIPPPPVTFACSASPHSIYPGEPVTITGTADLVNAKKHLVYTWSGDGVTGSGAVAKVDTTALAPGTHTIHGSVTVGPKPGESADCSATFTVKAFEPPTVSCSTNPATVAPGQSSTITATGASPQNRPITYAFSASAGVISGNGNMATLSTAGAPPGAIVVTCSSLDDTGQTASSQALVTVEAPASATHPPEARRFTCNAAPAQARPGDPVELSVSPLQAGDRPIWEVAAGVLDSGMATAIVDTSHLKAGKVSVTVSILNEGRPVGECGTAFTIDPKAPVIAWPNLDIVRTALREGQTEAPGYAVYTYLLYRVKPSSSEDVARFKSILAVIGDSYAAPEVQGQHGLEQTAGDKLPEIKAQTEVISRRKLAEIVVPVTKSGDFTSQALFDNYDPALASKLLRHLNCQQANDASRCVGLLSGDGPYLVSTLVRLTGHPEAVLVQNLAGTTPDAGGQWVTSWMAMVRQKSNWTNLYTMQKASLAFAKDLDKLGIAMTNGHDSVASALAFLRPGQRSKSSK